VEIDDHPHVSYAVAQELHKMQKSNKNASKGKQSKKTKQAQSSNSGDAPLSKASLGPGQAKARERRNNDGSRTIFFEEYVQDINGSVAFSAASFPVQPGVATLFAWLASQAIAYQEYRVESLSFRFESEREATVPGKLMLAFQPDPSDALPAGKQEMLENEFKAKCKAWENCRLTLPQRFLQKEALQRTRFVRSGTLAANLDIKLYDLGQLIVASQGQADAAGIGELYVEYGITLFTPVISAGAQAAATSASIASGSATSKTAQFGTAGTVTGGLAVTAATNTLTFQRVGKYFVEQVVTGTGLFTSFNPTFTGTATTTVNAGISNAAANAGTSAIVSFTVNVKERGQTCIVDSSAISTTITATTTTIAVWALS
jgi:hypothetical protein